MGSQTFECAEKMAAALADAERELAKRPECWSCPDCAFTFDQQHTTADGSLVCPLCELAALREDRERLDWLEEHPGGVSYSWGLEKWFLDDREGRFPSIRAAIDAARKGET